MRAGIALGSNLGNRHAHLKKAIQELQAIHEQGEFLISSFYETEPVDCPPESPGFLNAVVELDTALKPEALLEKLQHLEIQSGRTHLQERNAPRCLDLDILYVGECMINTPGLQIPHPRMLTRLFVMQPLAEIRPNLMLIKLDLTAFEYFYKISNNTA